jgi:hypothetical protein
LKAVILGNTKLNYSWFVLTYRQGLKLNNVDVYDIDYKSTPIESIKKKLIDIRADYCFTHLSFHQNINPIGKVLQLYKDVNRTVGTKFIHTLNDARTEDRYMGDISDSIYMAFVGNLNCLETCSKAWNIPVFYAPYSSLTYDKMSKPVKDLCFKDPVFTGSPTAHPDRSNFIKKLQKYTSIKIFQTQSKQDLRNRTPELSVSSHAILGLCTGYDIDGYIDVRPFQYLGTGAVLIARKFKNVDHILPPDIYYPFDGYTEDDAKKVVDIYKNKCFNKENNLLRDKAFNYIQQNHSCKVRVKSILDILKGVI